jgi:hypothetical protein
MTTRPIEWIYLNNGDNKIRYALGEKGNRMVACIGVNPSTAEPDKLDNTLSSVKRIAIFNEYDGWVMFNVYPQRATDISNLDFEVNDQVVQENTAIIKRTIIEHKIDTVWLAFGDLIEYRPYLHSCLLDLFDALKELGIKWKIILNPTQKGHPRHPLYKASANGFIDFDMPRYVKEVLKFKA